MPVHAFRASDQPPLFGTGTLADARRFVKRLNETRDAAYRLDKPTDGELALYAGQTFSLKLTLAGAKTPCRVQPRSANTR